jgi:hypothetical protein
MKTSMIPAVALVLTALLLGLLLNLRGAQVGASAQVRAGGSQYVVLHTAAITNSNGTTITANVLEDAFSALTVQAKGMVSGTLNFEGTINGADYVALVGQNVSTAATGTTTTAAGIYRVDVTGLSEVRVRVSGITTTTTDAITVVGWLTRE